MIVLASLFAAATVAVAAATVTAAASASAQNQNMPNPVSFVPLSLVSAVPGDLTKGDRVLTLERYRILSSQVKSMQ